MRTMITLEDSLHRDARIYAAEHGITLTALIEEALRLRLARIGMAAGKKPVSLPTFKGDGLQPGITLDHMETVYDRADGLR